MKLFQPKCGTCYSKILGRKQSLFSHKNFGRLGIGRGEFCKTKVKEETIDRGKLLEHTTFEKVVARCPECGRTENGDWIKKEVEKEWKDEGCE